MSYHGAGPMVPVSTLAKVYMFAPGHPALPPRTAFVRVLKRHRDGRIEIAAFDGQKRSLGTVVARWVQTAPVATPMKTQPWWTKTGYWGPLVTPESEVGPVPMAPAPRGGV